MRFLALVLCFLTVSTAMAGDLVVATVDMQKLFKEYPGTAPAQKKFDAVIKKKKKELTKAEKVLKRLQTELAAISDTTSPAAQKKQAEFQQTAKDYEDQKNTIQTELADRQGEMTQTLVDQIKVVVAKVAQSEGVGLVLDSNDTVSLKSSMDLTADVLAQFTMDKVNTTDLSKSSK